MNKKVKILSEDNSMIYNRWVSGIAKREAPADVITVDDIVNRYRNDMSGTAPKQLPFPLNMLLDLLGNIFIKTAEMRKTVVDSINYPIIKESKRKIKAVKILNLKIKKIQDILYSCTDQLNDLVDNSKDQDKI